MTDAETRTCSLKLAAHGIPEACPRDSCAFWAEDGCAIERLGIDLGVHDLAAYLLEVRAQLETTRDLQQAADLRGQFARRLGREL